MKKALGWGDDSVRRVLAAVSVRGGVMILHTHRKLGLVEYIHNQALGQKQAGPKSSRASQSS